MCRRKGSASRSSSVISTKDGTEKGPCAPIRAAALASLRRALSLIAWLPPRSIGADLARIEAALKSAVKPAAFTRLIAVSKGHGIPRYPPALEAGHRLFGESRVQEAQAKWTGVEARIPRYPTAHDRPFANYKLREATDLLM